MSAHAFGVRVCPCSIRMARSIGRQSWCRICFCMALGLPHISSSLQAFLYTVLQWNLGVRVSQQPKKRILNIHDHDPCSTTSDPKEDLNVVLCLWLKEVLWILMELKPRNWLVCLWSWWPRGVSLRPLMLVLRREKEKETEGCPWGSFL